MVLVMAEAKRLYQQGKIQNQKDYLLGAASRFRI